MMLADLNVEMVGQVVVADLDGEIDMSNANELGEALGRQVTNEALGLVVDLTEITYLDSAAIQIIYELRERLQTRGQQIRLVIAPDSPIADALRIAGVPAAVGSDDTRDAALHALGESMA
jgi:anti-sigma B factor antagonist